MKNIKYISLLLLLASCGPTVQPQQVNTSMDKLDSSIKSLIQDYDAQKKDIEGLNDGLLNVFKPYCNGHKGLNMVISHVGKNTLIVDYPFEVDCKDGFSRILKASDVERF